MTQEERQQRISEVFRLAVELPADARTGFLQQACQGNPEILNDVEELLAEHRESAPPRPIPQQIGKYTVSELVGSGGFGQVYRALDPTVGRVVAVKVMNSPGDADLVKRFRAEAKTAANLRHKNIVTIHEFGEDGGVPYLVMEFLDGISLQDLIRRKSLSLLEKLEIMTEVAEGLRHAHDSGVTHRDVKPANIMRLADGSVKILDFGIARIAAEASMRLTRTGLVVGSLEYMAPEQFHGTSDALSDVFAYGVTFYELLTGENPFAAPSPAVTMFRITNLEPPPLGAAVPDAPEALDRLLRSLLAKNRAARCVSMADAVTDVRPILLDLRRDRAVRHFREAQELVRNGQMEPARAAIRKVLELDPMHAAARELRGQVEEALRASSQRSAFSDQLLDVTDPQNPEGKKLLREFRLPMGAQAEASLAKKESPAPLAAPYGKLPEPAPVSATPASTAPVSAIPAPIAPASPVTLPKPAPVSTISAPILPRKMAWLLCAAAALAVAAFLLWPRRTPPPDPVPMTIYEKPDVVPAAIPLKVEALAATATLGDPFFAEPPSAGGAPPYSWTLVDGALPPGLTMTPGSGQIDGIPTQAGSFHGEARVSDSTGQTAVRGIDIHVAPLPQAASVENTPAAKPAAAGCTARPFHLETYGDLRSGEMIWDGALAASQRLEIRNNVPSNGVLKGDLLPLDVPVRLTIAAVGHRNLELLTKPAAEACWTSHLVIRNSGAALSELQIHWEVFQP